ncbi:MAG: VacB/RNase II family 3'-5' exoribonuclease, partial [Rikenellaceae bacterium]
MRQKKSKHEFDRAGFILNMFKEMPNNKFSLKHLASSAGCGDRNGRHEVLNILKGFVEQGLVAETSRGKFHLAAAELPRHVGKVVMTKSGSIFVECEDLESDIHVSPFQAQRALHGDMVEVVIVRQSMRGRSAEGEVVRIVERNKKVYIGIAEVSAHQIFIRSTSRQMPFDVFLPKKKYPTLEDGTKVSFRVKEWSDGAKSPVGELIEVLGAVGDNDTEMHAILTEYDLPYAYPQDVVAAAEAIPSRITKADYAERRDFRDVVTFTVDPADAKDFDDALSVRKVSEGVWEIGVHIADVTHYVRPDSIIESEARERATSVYLVDRTIPMLPERLSNELCSLRPHEESLCFSAVFTIDSDLKIVEEWFGRTVIYSDRRFTYAEAQEVIETGVGDYAEEVLKLNELAQRLRAERFKRGAIAFERDEMKFELDEKGRPIGVFTKEAKESNKMIEEFMLLANRQVAIYCSKRVAKGRKYERTMVYRVHDEPNAEKIDSFRQFIMRFGLSFKATKGVAIAREINKLLGSIKGNTEENVVSMLAIRSMSKALYTTENIGHYGLAFPYYTHFTSPIRRYPDMMVHRLRLYQ